MTNEDRRELMAIASAFVLHHMIKFHPYVDDAERTKAVSDTCLAIESMYEHDKEFKKHIKDLRQFKHNHK